MVWSGSPFAHQIEFSTGHPTGAVSLRLLGNDGAELHAQDIPALADEFSKVLLIDGAHNTCALPLFENRTLTWHYLTGKGLVTGRVMYKVENPIPFLVTADGVRAKLGVETHELPEESIDLMTGYAEFLALFEQDLVSPFATTGSRETLLCSHAIEAMAALLVIDTLQLKIAQRETSGTNEFQRYSATDWNRLESSLSAHIERARIAVDPNYDGSGTDALLFTTVTRTDALTGEDPSA